MIWSLPEYRLAVRAYIPGCEDRQSGFGAPANLADWPRQGSNPGPIGFEAKRLSRPVSREPTPLITGRNARFNRAISTLPGSG